MELEARREDPELVTEMFRAAHTLKGGAAVVGFDHVAAVVHQLEQLLEELRSGSAARRRAGRRRAGGRRRGARDGGLRDGGRRRERRGERARRDRRARASASRGADDPATPSPMPVPPPPARAALEARPRRGVSRGDAGRRDGARRRGRGARGGERDRPGVGCPAIAEHVNLPARRAGAGPAPRPPRRPVRRRRIAVPVARLDELVRLVGESAAALLRIGRLLSERLGDDPAVVDEYRELARVLHELQERTMRARMVSVGTVAGPLRRAVRDIARASGKRVRWELDGEDTELDRHVLEQLREPLVALVRNAADHGVEPPGERAERGKPEEAVVRVQAGQVGADVVIAVSDDGRGIDVDRVSASAGRRLERRGRARRHLRARASAPRGARERRVGARRRARRRALGRRRPARPGRGPHPRGARDGVPHPRADDARRGALPARPEPAPTATPCPCTRPRRRCPRRAEARSSRRGAPRAAGRAARRSASPTSRPSSARRRPARPRPPDRGGAHHRGGTARVRRGRARRPAATSWSRTSGASFPASPLVAGASVEPDGGIMLVLDPDGLVAAAARAAPQARRRRTRPDPPRRRRRRARARRRRRAHRPRAAAIDPRARRVRGRDGGRRARRAAGARRARRPISCSPTWRCPAWTDSPSRRRSAPARARGLPVIILTSRGDEEDRRRGLEAGADAYLVKERLRRRRAARRGAAAARADGNDGRAAPARPRRGLGHPARAPRAASLQAGGDIVVVAEVSDADAAVTAVAPPAPGRRDDGPRPARQRRPGRHRRIMAETPTPILVLSGLIDGVGAARAVSARSPPARSTRCPSPRAGTRRRSAQLRRHVRTVASVPVVGRRRRRAAGRRRGDRRAGRRGGHRRLDRAGRPRSPRCSARCRRSPRPSCSSSTSTRASPRAS